jgi:peptide/nickel transport system ATP-binding protein
MIDEPFLAIQNLQIDVGTGANRVHAGRGVNLTVQDGARLGIIGESGSGKTMSALAILRLLPTTTTVLDGAIRYAGRDLLALSERAMQQVRGKEISMIFQNAVAALNPLFTVGQQIADVYRYHEGGSGRAAWDKAVAMLDATGIPDPARRARAYPHQFSGGMAQRAMIAMSLVCSPRLLIADEPTTGLDLTIQAQVLDLIEEHVERTGATLILISHDLAVIAATCNELAVMYAGEVVERGRLDELFRTPRHPYSQALLECFQSTSGESVPYIAGRVPDLRQPLVGCSFAPRCPLVQEICRQQRPALRPITQGHQVACQLAQP